MSQLSFGARLTIYILFATISVFLLVFGYNYTRTEETTRDLSRESALYLATGTVGRIEQVLQRVEQVPRYLAARLTANDISPQEVETALKDFVSSNPDVYGATVAFAQGVLPEVDKPYAPYFYKKGNELQMVQLGNEGYQYWYQDWYMLPRQAGKPVWSEPYFDTGGGDVAMTTFSVPVYRTIKGKKRFLAVITADISIDWLKRIVQDIKIYETGYAFILSSNAVFVVDENDDFIMRSDHTIYELAVEAENPELKTLGYRMTAGKSGIMPMLAPKTKNAVEVLYTPITVNGWSLGLVIPEDELFSELHAQSITILALAISGILGIAVLVCFVAYNATRPLRALSASASEISEGHLDVGLPSVSRMDEIGRLALSFEEMRTALKEYIEDLTNTTAAKERIESELKIAKTIQASFLPKRFPPFPDRGDFDIFATLVPAREVGGDLYDFFILDDRHLFFSVGDVSDKGVPAALFMAVTKTLMKGIAEHERDPAQILCRVNDELASDNDSCMFVTLFCGVLDLHTGELVYSNAGHDAPFLIRKNELIGALELPPGLVLGAMQGALYQNRRMTLTANDKLLLFTDGVTEAMSTEGELFSMERLSAVASENSGKPIQDLIDCVMSAVHHHAEEALQSDDITLLALHWHGRLRD